MHCGVKRHQHCSEGLEGDWVDSKAMDLGSSAVCSLW